VKTIESTNRFLRDIKLARKRGKDLHRLETVVDALARGERLAPRHRRSPVERRDERTLGMPHRAGLAVDLGRRREKDNLDPVRHTLRLFE